MEFSTFGYFPPPPRFWRLPDKKLSYSREEYQVLNQHWTEARLYFCLNGLNNFLHNSKYKKNENLPMSVEVEETGIEFVSCHWDKSVKKIQELRSPVKILFHDHSCIGVITWTIPTDQTWLVFPFSVYLNQRLRN